MSRFLRPLIQDRTYLETFDLLLDLVVGTLWFTAFTTLIATGASLLITLVGLPILTGAFYLVRAAAYAERARVRAFLGLVIDKPAYKPPKTNGVWHRLIAPLGDRTTWKELAYVWLVQPILGVVDFTVAVTAWAVPL
jgi:Putative sensor